ncbi:MAG: hypothetical protein M3475_04910 [Actinomycetota bacterium]|nr:hypothetical protein [Actinomycetota bacterium]
MSSDSVKDVENYLSPSEAGYVLGTSGNWVKQLVRRGELEGVETHLGWLIAPESVVQAANARAAKAERRASSLKMKVASSQAPLMNEPAGGRAAHGKTLRSKSRKP